MKIDWKRLYLSTKYIFLTYVISIVIISIGYLAGNFIDWEWHNISFPMEVGKFLRVSLIFTIVAIGIFYAVNTISDS